MRVTLLLTVGMMALFALMIWVVTAFLPLNARVASFWPEDIQEKLKPRLESLAVTPRRVVGRILFVLIVLGMLCVYIYAGWDGIRNSFSYGEHLLRLLCIGMGVKLLDIIGFDWFVMTKTHFFQRYFPETEGCAGWQRFGYNRAQQFRQCLLILLAAPITAAVFWWIGQ